MKRILLVVGIFLLISLAKPTNAFAYGEGGWAPPFPYSWYKLVCVEITIKLPFHRIVKVPRCHLEKIIVNPPSHESGHGDFNNRFNNFVNLVVQGGK